MRKLLILLIFLGTVFSSSYARDSNLDKKFALYVSGGRSQPAGDFKTGVKSGFNCGGGIEYRFLPNWAIGTSIRKTNFEHRQIWYSPEELAWIYTDWIFIHTELYGKYLFMRKCFSPYLSLGTSVYFTQYKRTSMKEIQGKRQYRTWNNDFSFTPSVGLQYTNRRVLFFGEIGYNIAPTGHVGGIVNVTNEFFYFLFGVGLCLDI
jgi:hypothetical protein